MPQPPSVAQRLPGPRSICIQPAVTSSDLFPSLRLADWQPTRDAIHSYAQVLGKIREALTPRQRHWWHISLQVTQEGLCTLPIPLAPSGQSFRLLLDLRQHRLTVDTPDRSSWTLPLAAPWSRQTFSQATLNGLADLGIMASIDREFFSSETPVDYHPVAAERFSAALAQVDAVFRQFQASLPGETSPVQLWPHHFDLALAWFTGRKVPGYDEADEEWADEQMGFGFSTGDAGFPDAYFYVTAYPWPHELDAAPLKRPARWVREGWKGALLPYAALTRRKRPGAFLIDFLSHIQQMASSTMLALAPPGSENG